MWNKSSFNFFTHPFIVTFFVSLMLNLSGVDVSSLSFYLTISVPALIYWHIWEKHIKRQSELPKE